MELLHANYCVYKIRHQMIFYVLSIVIFLGNGIINYLKDICFEIGRRYCFDFDAICTDGDHVHLWLVVNQNIFFQTWWRSKKNQERQIFEEYILLKKFGSSELRIEVSYIWIIGDGTTSYVIKKWLISRGTEEKSIYAH
jgi:putative transposase